MRTFLIVLSFLFFAPAFAGAPTKSSVCALVLQTMVRHSYREEPYIYTINTLRALRENILQVNKITAGTPEGFISDRYHELEFGTLQVAQRILGIEHFATTGVDASNRNYMKVLVLVGKDNIENFVTALEESFDGTNKKITFAILNHYKVLFTVAGLLLPIQFLDRGDATRADVAIMAVLGALSVTSHADHLLLRPFFKDRTVRKALNSFRKLLREPMEHYSWALFSRNANLTENSLELAAQNNIDPDELTQALASQSLIEVPSLLQKIEKKQFVSAWAGVDFFLETRLLQEPELHIIFRSSDKRPDFPKVVKVDESPKTAIPYMPPGPQPVR